MKSGDVTYRPLIRAGIFLGMGLGGFLDGIVFHQLLQTHSMLSATVPKTSIVNQQINMFWDGLFHGLTWSLIAAGLALFWRAGKRAEVPWAGKTFIASLFMGWGIFNFVEGIVNHYVLQIHHVVERLGLSAFDALYVLSGVLLFLGSLIAIRREANRELVLHPEPART